MGKAISTSLTPPSAEQSLEYSLAHAATSSTTQHSAADPWKSIPLPSVADVDEKRVQDSLGMLQMCQSLQSRAQACSRNGRVGVTQERVIDYCAMIREVQAAKRK